jgi:hypothetical protein
MYSLANVLSISEKVIVVPSHLVITVFPLSSTEILTSFGKVTQPPLLLLLFQEPVFVVQVDVVHEFVVVG